VKLFGAETGKIEDILNSCDQIILRYMTREAWNDRVSSEEVAKRCGLKEFQEKETAKAMMVLSYEKGGRGLSAGVKFKSSYFSIATLTLTTQ